MKLLKENLVQPIELITESTKGGGQSHYLSGPFLQADIKNKNGRIYSLSVMENAVNLYREEKINTNRAYGELSHPEGPNINLERVSHLITELNLSKSTYHGKAKILEHTPCGKIVSELLKAGAGLGVSSRGMGSLKEENGCYHVQDDYRISTAADVVADPSAPEAFVQGIMESADWIWQSGVWKISDLEESKKSVRDATRRHIQEEKLRIFKKLMRII